jgi:hypothetical protein
MKIEQTSLEDEEENLEGEEKKVFMQFLKNGDLRTGYQRKS